MNKTQCMLILILQENSIHTSYETIQYFSGSNPDCKLLANLIPSIDEI